MSDVQPFESFSLIYKILIWAEYFKLMDKPKSRFKLICHQLYRLFAFLVAAVYNLQHVVFIVKRRDNIADVFDALMIEVAQLNLLVKFLTMNLQIPRIDKLNELIKGLHFAAKTKEDGELLAINNTDMHRLSKYILIGITFSALFWPSSYFMARHQSENAVVPSYVPFATDSWGKFAISVALEVIPLLWVGYGHIAMDLVVATYYAQAEVQIKIIKQGLEHLFDTDNALTTDVEYRYGRYRDVIDTDLKRQFVYYVQRFDKLAWYTKEVDRIFNPAMSFQFFTSTISLCLVVYKLSYTPVASVSFTFLALLMVIYSTQIFLYCYFGNLVQYESQSVVNSLYLSDWLSVSPQFRRLLLIAMLRWTRPLTPTVSGIIPLSLNTFISICRSAYSLYAVLVTK